MLLADAPAAHADDAAYGEIGDALRSEVDAPAHTAGLARLERPYARWKESLRERTGLVYLVEYAPIFQWGSRGPDRLHANHELNVIGAWSPKWLARCGQGRLLAWYQNSVTINDVTTSDLMASLGVLSPVNGGDTAPETAANRLQLLAYEHTFCCDRVRVMVGKLTTRVLMNLNRYAVSDREDFLSPMLVNNPVVAFTARISLGAFAEYRRRNWYVSGLVREADGTTDWIQFDTLDSGAWEYTGEFGWTPTLCGLGQGNYRITTSYSDAVATSTGQLPSGWSLSVSCDQDIGRRVGAFVRYSVAENPFRAFRQRAAAGAQFKFCGCASEDRIGIGGWWGDPTSGALRDEFGCEAFWRVQLTPLLQITLAVQGIFDPALAPDRSAVFTTALRARLEL